ncbi:MAG: DUF7716 domain-containing protein [Pseudoalteromonas sp.]
MIFKVGEGVTLRSYLADLQGNRFSEWMISDVDKYSLEMLIYPVYLETWDLNPEEYELIEDAVLSQGNGFGNVLSAEQLEDIISNLKMQKAGYSDAELETAINYYDENDAFFELENT